MLREILTEKRHLRVATWQPRTTLQAWGVSTTVTRGFNCEYSSSLRSQSSAFASDVGNCVDGADIASAVRAPTAWRLHQ